VDLQVGRLGLAIEVQREVVGREDLAERHGRRQSRDLGDVAVVDPEAPQCVVQEGAERVGPGAGDHRAASPVARRGHRDVGRAAAEVLAERLDLA
jgi:hypothetical protein